MKVLFINPPREGFYLITERQVPIGIFYLAESCRKAGFETAVLDMLTGKIVPRTVPRGLLSRAQKAKADSNPIFSDFVRYGMEDEDALEEIGRFRPSVVCVSIMFSCFHDSAERLAQKIRTRFPSVVIVAGGAHVTTNFREVLKCGAVDYCLRYEGEETLPRLLKLIVNGMPAGSVEGIAYGRDPAVTNDGHT